MEYHIRINEYSIFNSATTNKIRWDQIIMAYISEDLKFPYNSGSRSIYSTSFCSILGSDTNVALLISQKKSPFVSYEINSALLCKNPYSNAVKLPEEK